MSTRVVLGGVVFLSGACALLFQTIWFREFRLFFGGSTPATAAVLAAFMGGLGLGNALFGKYVQRSSHPLRFYACLEGVIALSAGLSPFLIAAVGELYIWLGGQERLGTIGAAVVRLVFSMLVLIVPTVCMGGTLPAIAKAVTRRDDFSRRGIAMFYGLNTMGAVFGTAFATLYLLEHCGNRAALWLTSCLGLLLASVVCRLSFTEEFNAAKDPTARGKASEALRASRESNLARWMVYLSAGIVGFSFFVMELVWYRMLGPLLGGNTFTFGLILAVALLGMGLGGAIYAIIFRNFPRNATTFGITCALEAVAIVLPFAWGDGVAYWLCDLRQTFGDNYAGLLTAWSLVAVVVVGPAAVVSGIQFPLLIALLGEGEQDVGTDVGWACTFNTVGAMVGSLLGGFGILPLLSAPGTWRAVVGVLVALTIAIVVRECLRSLRWQVMFPAAIAVCAALLCLFPGPSAVWRHSGIGAGRNMPPQSGANDLREWENSRKRNILWERDGVESSIAITKRGGLSLYLNGKSDGNALGDRGTQIMLGVIGPLLHDNPRTGLVIGMGTGESAGFCAALPGIERVDVVELEPAVDEMARLCAAVNYDVMQNPRVHRIYNDAREMLVTTHERYDVIVSEPSNPYRAGVASLFTTEFYDAVRQRLAPGGYFVQWLQGYEIADETAKIVLATLHQRFGAVQVWCGTPVDLLLVCTAEPVSYDAAVLQKRLAEPAYSRATLLSWGTNSLEGVLGQHIASPALTKRLAESVQVVSTDDFNKLEYTFARSLGFTESQFVEQLRKLAVVENADRLSIRGEVDWKRVEEERLNAFIWAERPLPQTYPKTKTIARRYDAYSDYLNGKSALAKEFWKTREPVGVVETRMFAPLYAREDTGRVQRALAKLDTMADLPASTLLMAAVCDRAAGKLDSSKEKLLLGFEQLANDPWINKSHTFNAFAIAIDFAGRDNEFKSKVYRFFEKPFAMYAMNEDRLAARLSIAQFFGNAERVQAVAAYEPYVFWDESFLKKRRDAYRAVNDPRLQLADDDYTLFLQQGSNQKAAQ